jgi:uncharacterized phage-like protein YoqJ
MFYKIRNNNAPSYLCDCLLPFERNENACNLRNQTDYSNRLEIADYVSTVHKLQHINNTLEKSESHPLFYLLVYGI